MTRPLAALPKAHLHLHFTGAMRHPTLVELARERRVHLPDALAAGWPPQLRGTDERGWFRFQRLYDIARSVLREPADVFRLLAETAADERAEGSGWLEIQVDPSGYAARFGGLTPVVELVLEAARAAEAATGVGIGVIIAANRTKHPLEARTLARLAAQYAGRGVAVYWVSTESDSAKSKNYVSDEDLRDLGRKYKITVLRDPDGAISKRLGVDQLPATVIINKQGQVAATVGGLDPNADFARQMAERLDKVL